ncbi:unnamed protein product [Closterium sp. NIES-53]
MAATRTPVANRAPHRPQIRRPRLDVVPETDRNGSGGEGEGARDKDDDEDEDDDEEEEEGDGWNDDDENYLENSLSALDEDEADDNDQGDEQWFNGPETNPWCLRKYVTFLANETVAQADRMATLKRPDKTLKKRRQCTPAMLMGRLKALNLLIKLDGAIFRKPVLNLLRDFVETCIWVPIQVRDEYKRFIAEHMDRHRGTAVDTYTPDQFKHMMWKTSMAAILNSYTLAKHTYTQGLHRDLCIRTMIVLGHHTLARGRMIRNLQLPDMMMWKLGAKSETDPVKDAFIFICVCRTGKTNKDFSLNYISAVRHIDWTLCAVGAMLMWLHWVYDMVPVVYEDIAPPLDFSEPLTWYDQYVFFPFARVTRSR